MADRDFVVREFGAIEGGKQALARQRGAFAEDRIRNGSAMTGNDLLEIVPNPR
jgi:hypothetical protein